MAQIFNSFREEYGPVGDAKFVASSSAVQMVDRMWFDSYGACSESAMETNVSMVTFPIHSV